jgi:hypothetical protein
MLSENQWLGPNVLIMNTEKRRKSAPVLKEKPAQALIMKVKWPILLTGIFIQLQQLALGYFALLGHLRSGQNEGADDFGAGRLQFQRPVQDIA